jgi:hypothetical protein
MSHLDARDQDIYRLAPCTVLSRHQITLPLSEGSVNRDLHLPEPLSASSSDGGYTPFSPLCLYRDKSRYKQNGEVMIWSATQSHATNAKADGYMKETRSVIAWTWQKQMDGHLQGNSRRERVRHASEVM